jgi:dehydrogenase/reductase SDR family protein 7B
MVVIKCDLSDKDSVAKLGREAAPLDVDVLVNNGGISSRSSFLQTRLEVDELLMQVNFLSGASLAKALVPAMVERGSGAILWISSVQGLLGIPNRTSYAASKFAVQGYCEALRGELASSGITVHVASPGYIRTNLSKSAITGDGSPHGKMDSTTERGRFGVKDFV